MILALLLGGAILTWYIDKVYDGVTDLVNEKGKSIKKPENDGEMRDQDMKANQLEDYLGELKDQGESVIGVLKILIL